MIVTLDDAWRWYSSVKQMAQAMATLGRYWESLPWDGDLGRNNRLRDLGANEVIGSANLILKDLDDLGVLLLFSVFEARVRGHVTASVKAELPEVRHPALQLAVRT